MEKNLISSAFELLITTTKTNPTYALTTTTTTTHTTPTQGEVLSSPNHVQPLTGHPICSRAAHARPRV